MCKFNPNAPTAKAEITTQIELLKFQISGLEPCEAMLNVIRTRAGLDSIEDCELEMILSGIESLLCSAREQINDRVDFIAKMLGVADNVAFQHGTAEKLAEMEARQLQQDLGGENG